MKPLAISTLMLAALIAAPTLTRAQSVEPIGEIRMTFQSEDMRFHTLRVTRTADDVETTTTVGTIGSEGGGFGAVKTLSLIGTIGEDSRGGAVHLTHHFADQPQDGASGIFAEGSAVAYFPDQTKPPFWVDADGSGNAEISFDRYEFDGSTGHASGTFTGRVCRQDDLSVEADASICEVVTGSFDTPIVAEAE